MTRKDYAAIAAALRAVRKKFPLSGGVNEAVHLIAEVLAKDNPRFDRARFCQACGMGELP